MTTAERELSEERMCVKGFLHTVSPGAEIMTTDKLTDKPLSAFMKPSAAVKLKEKTAW